MTVNISLCFLTILGGVTLGHVPLNVIQMLWVNLIMDILGAIAIGTEKYGDKVSPRISRNAPIILSQMWRQILGQALYQIVVMTVLMYFGGLMFFEESFNLITTPLRVQVDGEYVATNRLVLDTICFYTFILMNLFNMINCRIIEDQEFNPLKNICNNLMFWVIFALDIGITELMLFAGDFDLGSALIGTAPLSFWQRFTCWVLGALSIGVNLGLKKIPKQHLDFMRRNINLEKQPDSPEE